MNILLEPQVLLVLTGCCLLGASAGAVGIFSFLQKKALFSDAVAHAVLPGVALSFIITGQKNPIYLIIGAVLSGWLALLSIDVLSRRTKLKPDTTIGIALTLFFGMGILMLTAIQHTGKAAQSGLDSFLFGKAAAMQQNDVLTFGLFSILIILVVFLFFKELRVMTFNREYAVSIGLPVRWFDFLLATLNVMAVAIGIQAVGVVLMSALLITPASASRFWTNKLRIMVLLAAAIGAASGLLGGLISLTAPSMPTGPWIVVVLTLFALFSIFLAPQRGLWAKAQKSRRNRQKMNRENILKMFFRIGEENSDFSRNRNRSELLNWKGFNASNLESGLLALKKTGLLTKTGNDYSLTPEGLKEAARIVRLHRLWELYLTRRLHLPVDHVHQDAEAIEHVITPEIEALLIQDLGHPLIDPHNSQIP